MCDRGVDLATIWRAAANQLQRFVRDLPILSAAQEEEEAKEAWSHRCSTLASETPKIHLKPTN